MDNLPILEFLTLPGPILDVRSPGEFGQGHIPKAINMPLFTDEERAAIGTIYKKEGKDSATELGIQFASPKLSNFVATAKRLRAANPVKVHCWRGGMRSSSVAWLLNTAGIPTVTLHCGYKAFRTWALKIVQQPLHLKILGGFTGSGKTAILHELQNRGEQVLDLEALASHRGSSYGTIGMAQQPSTEQFENEIACRWASFNPDKPVWIEDESRMIGKCKIPDPIFNLMHTGTLFFIDSPQKQRIQRLGTDYGNAPILDLIAATKRLEKKMGRVLNQQAINLILAGKIDEAISLTLHYYDNAYQHTLCRRKQTMYKIQTDSLSPRACAEKLLTTLDFTLLT